MRSMAELLLTHLRDGGVGPDVSDLLESRLVDLEYDIETLIDELDAASRGAGFATRWGVPEDGRIAELRIMLAEVEWFVAHQCERVDSGDATRLWRPALRALVRNDSTVITTNYDRSIELAAAKAGIELDDGFPPFGDGEWVDWRGVARTGLRLLKLHGSTDWYHDGSKTQTVKLRHAMPLFGRVRVSLASGPAIDLESALILPSREKKVTLPPYPDLAYEFGRALEFADLAVFVGSSFRDPDLRALVAKTADRTPTLTVSRRGIPVGNASPIRCSASRFLISTFPRMLRLASAADAVSVAAADDGNVDKILDDVVTAFSDTEDGAKRCDAINRLAAARVAFERDEVLELLADADEAVRTFGLGLVLDSPDVDELKSDVVGLAATLGGASFEREAGLLDTVA